MIAEKLDAPILTTTAGKGAVPADHRLCMGYKLGLVGGTRLHPLLRRHPLRGLAAFRNGFLGMRW